MDIIHSKEIGTDTACMSKDEYPVKIFDGSNGK